MTHILIVNQHGENRGDEAAMRAMLESYDSAINDLTFTLLYQFRDKELKLTFKEDVEALPIVLPLFDYIRALIYTIFKFIRLDFRFLLPPTFKKIIAAYDKADLVVSAPGGPYFGDIYASHEIVHWWYILMGSLFNKPIFLYATSAGPFNNKVLNVVRKLLYKKFSKLVVREELSASYLKQLLGENIDISITADSAIQANFTAYDRAEYFTSDKAELKEKFLVAVSLNDYRYPDCKEPLLKKSQYNEIMLKVLEYLDSKENVHFLLLPQLYGKVHDDEPYLRVMAEQLPSTCSWEIVDSNFNSDMQRELFAMCDFHIASRYHPAIFGNTSYVPGICVYYEHKAVGFMKQLGLERFCFDINNLSYIDITHAIDDILENRTSLIEYLKERVPEVREKSARTTELSLDLISRNQ